MRIAIVSDAWKPQVNGVVRTLEATIAELGKLGHVIEMITPDRFRTVPCPGYPEIRLAIGPGRRIAAILERFAPDAIHLATEGPLGWSTRRWCLRHGKSFTTSFHTRFPDYLALRTRLPARLFWTPLRRFHSRAARVFTATATLEIELHRLGLQQTHRWGRGVDLDLFTPDGEPSEAMADAPKPVMLCVGRVAAEKNIEAFLSANLPGSKVVVGDGPSLEALRQRFPDVMFLGALHGTALAAAYRTADVLVFPSRTDTFGLVMAEAIACGTPVAAFPVGGPVDVVSESTGVLDGDLTIAIRSAIALGHDAISPSRPTFDWTLCTRQFVAGLTSAEAAMA